MNLFNLYQQLRQNPMQLLAQKYNIPSNIDTSNPNNIIQYLLNTGQITQAQVNNAMSMRDNPMFKQLFNNK